MRENRSSGSEGGGVSTLPTPIKERERMSFRGAKGNDPTHSSTDLKRG